MHLQGSLSGNRGLTGNRSRHVHLWPITALTKRSVMKHLRCCLSQQAWISLLATSLCLPATVTSAGFTAQPQGPATANLHETTHKLMPGIVGRGINDPNWTRTQHDALATGFSPLICGMRKAPTVWAETKVAGSLNSLNPVCGPDDCNSLLVDDGRLRLVNSAGKVLWERSALGQLISSGDLHADGGNYGLFGAGRNVTLIDLNSGQELWRHSFEPAYVGVRAKVADILKEQPGLEAAIFLAHGEEACLISFPPHSKPHILWQRRVVNGEFNERYDHHGATFQLDLSQADQPVLWNLRRHRCRGFDARTGNLLSTLTYDIGGAERRNYGPMYLGHGRGGELLACVFGQRVQIHSHAIKLHRDGKNELAWQHYYGEVYKEAPGVAMEGHGVVDVNGDGADEMIYSVRDPDQEYRSFVRIRAADTGEIVFELADHWCLGIFANVGPDNCAGMLVLDAPDGQTPSRGDLEVYRFAESSQPVLCGELHAAGLWGPMTLQGSEGSELLIRENFEGTSQLSRFTIEDGTLRRVAHSSASALLSNPIQMALPSETSQEPDFVIQSGEKLRTVSWDGNELWSLDLQGTVACAVSAADLDNDDRAELVAAMPDKRLRIYSCDDGGLQEEQQFEHLLGWHNHHPVISDLSGDGRLCLLTAGSDELGRLVVRAHLPDGATLWETTLDVVAGQLRCLIFNTGKFLADGHTGVAVSMGDDRLVHEGTYMLDGQTGEVLWFKGLYRNDAIVMPYRPNGIPVAYDVDRDGREEIGMDMLSYMAFLRGSDGEFVLLRPTANITSSGAVFAGHLYNTYCPLRKNPQDPKPHWFVTAGFGPFGLINPDLGTGVWKEDLDYDVPINVALVDVDGDGELEAGYAAINDTKFICRDVWTGDVEWTLNLPSPPNAATITADFDGDGKGEFFTGHYCIGVDKEGKGEIRWQSPIHITWPIVADFDGDGQGEIAGGAGGKIVVLNN